MKKYQKILLTMFLLAWICVILFLSGQNGSEAFNLTYKLALPLAGCFFENPDNDRILQVMLVLRQAGRCVVFAVFGMLFNQYLDVMLAGMRQCRRRILLFGGIILFSVFDETHKLLIEGRHCTPQEILMNILSGFMGCVILYLVRKAWKPRKKTV